ncbi:MAG: aspartate kinase [Desulfobacteraceae bacterium]|nr:aspartate kinase [Desulfobacteraceae bacterium]
MKVIKIGGGCLNGKKTIARIVDLIEEKAKGHIIVVSALNGVTDMLISGMDIALEQEDAIPRLISRLKAQHINIAKHLIHSRSALAQCTKDIGKMLHQLERLLYGLNFTREITPRLYDVISSYGERFSAQLLTSILRSRGLPVVHRAPHKIGMITDGKFSDATAKLKQTSRQLKQHLKPTNGPDTITFIPGFFGVSPQGDITTFGRGGTDYSAAVVATAMNAGLLEIWKDVDGFMSADPRLVPEAGLIPVLSYEEAAELAYFGAKILHPRSVEPVRTKNINIEIKNTLNPDAAGSLITAKSPRSKSIIKSVAYDMDIAVLKVHASGVGARPGILAQVAGKLTENGINIRSVITSQTCISLLLSLGDVDTGRAALAKLKPRPYRRIEVLNDIALISIVGDGILRKTGIAARCFTAVANCGVNVEMISFGPSRAALYFLTKQKDLTTAVNAIHSTFFSSPRCTPNPG